MKKLSGVLILGVLMILSCGKEGVDISPPTLTFRYLNPAPHQGEICGVIEDSVFHLIGGDVLALGILFKDDRALSQYKIDIHQNFDCHGHGGSASPGFSTPSMNGETEDFSVLRIVSLSGVMQEVSESIEVPLNVTAGSYHFQVQVIDEAGNDNPQANIYSLKVLNPSDTINPILTVSSPQASFSVKKGDSVGFSGKLTDNRSLSEGGNGVLFLTYTDRSSGNTFLTDEVFPLAEIPDAMSYEFQFDFTVPVTLKAGSYYFTLRAQDGVRNVGMPVQFTVEVTD